MNYNRRNNIRLIDRISDLAVATIILSIAMMLFGLTMIIGSIICMSRGYSLVSSSSILLLTILRGIEYIADGIMLTAFCTFIATISPLANAMKMLRYISAVFTAYGAVVFILSLILGRSGLGSLVSLAGLTISGIIFFLLKQLDANAQKLAAPKRTATVVNLRKVG